MFFIRLMRYLVRQKLNLSRVCVLRGHFAEHGVKLSYITLCSWAEREGGCKRALSPRSSRLLLVDLDDVVLLHFEGLGCLVVVDPPAVKEEPQGGDGDADALCVGLLQLAHLSGHLDSEVDLVGVLAHHLQLDVLRLVLILRHGAGLCGTRREEAWGKSEIAVVERKREANSDL